MSIHYNFIVSTKPNGKINRKCSKIILSKTLIN